MASSSNEKHGQDLLAACAAFEEERLSASSVERLLNEVKVIAIRIGGSNVVDLASRRQPGHSVRVGEGKA